MMLNFIFIFSTIIYSLEIVNIKEIKGNLLTYSYRIRKTYEDYQINQ